jgi:hypothetical protein
VSHPKANSRNASAAVDLPPRALQAKPTVRVGGSGSSSTPTTGGPWLSANDRGSRPTPIQFIHAGIQVCGENGGSRVVWDTTVTPDELVDMFSPIYQEGLTNLKTKLES